MDILRTNNVYAIAIEKYICTKNQLYKSTLDRENAQIEFIHMLFG